MAKEIGVEPEDLIGAANKLLGTAEDQIDALSSARDSMYVKPADFGRPAASVEFSETYAAAVEQVGLAVEAAASVLEDEADALMRTGFAHHENDLFTKDKFIDFLR